MRETIWLEHFSSNLQSMMRDAKLSQRDVADMSGLSESTVSRYLTGKYVPNAIGILNLSYALDCEPTDLIDFGERVW